MFLSTQAMQASKGGGGGAISFLNTGCLQVTVHKFFGIICNLFGIFRNLLDFFILFDSFDISGIPLQSFEIFRNVSKFLNIFKSLGLFLFEGGCYSFSVATNSGLI